MIFKTMTGTIIAVIIAVLLAMTVGWWWGILALVVVSLIEKIVVRNGDN
jgi:predicted PurR-regulated permease PerM